MEDVRNPHSVEVGQIWADNKKPGRVIRVHEVVLEDDRPYAYCETLSSHRPAYKTKRPWFRLPLDRFNPASDIYRRIE